MSRFQNAKVVRKTLANGDWIEIRERISGAEKRKVSAAAFTTVERTDDPNKPKLGVDMSALPLSRTKAYLIDWSFKDDNDKPVKVTPEAIETLDDETLDEIEKILDLHIEEMDKLAKAQSGAPTSPQA